MADIGITSTTEAFERALELPPETQYILKLYVAGTTPRSLLAVERIRRLCDDYLSGRYLLEVIDIYQRPALAQDGDIVAAPTLVKQLPRPLRRVVGDMADEGRLLLALDIKSRV